MALDGRRKMKKIQMRAWNYL